MGPRDYTACPTTSSEDAFGDAFSTTLSETELKKGWRSMGRSTHIIIAGFLFSLVVLNGLSLYFWFGLSSKDATMKEHKILDYFLTTEDNRRLPGIVERVYWDYDDDFLNFNLSIAHDFWASLFPPGEGLVALTDQEVANLNLHHSQPARRDPTKRIYLVGVFHQLHCLSVLRAHTIHLFHDPSFLIEEATYHHTMHCADILRQALLCAADSSLIFKDENIKWPGDGGKLSCRNFDALRDWTLAHDYISEPEEPIMRMRSTENVTGAYQL